MERAQFLPFKKNTGVQLGLGIRNPAIYVATADKQRQTNNLKWVFGEVDSFEEHKHLVLTAGPKQKFLDSENDGTHDRDMTNAELEGDDILLTSTSDSDVDDYSSCEVNSELRSMAPLDSPNTLKIFRDVKLMTDHSYEIKVGSSIAPHNYLPGQILSTVESSNTESASKKLGDQKLGQSFFASSTYGKSRTSLSQFQIFDPTNITNLTMGPIHTTTDLRMNKDAQHIVAFASGETGSILSIGVVDKTRASTTLEFVGDISRYNLHSEIKNIVVPGFSTALNRASDILAVITANSLTVFKVKSIECSGGCSSIERLDPLGFSAFEDFAFVDIAFNPWDFNEFAIIDTKGNWSSGDIVKKGQRFSRLRLSMNKRGTVYDPEELSSWRRLEWGAQYFCLLAISRSKLIELNLKNRSQLEIIQANSWSSLRDFKRVSDQFAVLTTSKEIILMNFKNSDIERVVSWKHSLDPQDVTIRSEVRAVSGVEWGSRCDELFFIFVFSSLRPQILLHVFSRTDSMFQSVGKSSLLEVEGFRSGIDHVVIPQTLIVSNGNMGNDPSEAKPGFFSLVRECGSSTIWKILLSAGDVPSSHTNLDQEKHTASDMDSMMIASVPHRYVTLNSQLPKSVVDHDPSKEEAAFQQYGYLLSEGMNKLLTAWAQESTNEMSTRGVESFSLDELAHTVGYVESLEEFGSLLRQFQDHYKEQQVWFTELSTISSSLIRENVADLGLLYTRLLQCWNFGLPDDEHAVREMLKTVILKNTGICSLSQLSLANESVYEELSNEDRELLDVWDDADIDTKVVEPSPLELKSDLHTQHFQIPPFVKSSQNSPPKLRRPKDKRASRISQVASQPTLSTTNSVNSQVSAVANPTNVLPDTMTPAFSLTSASQPVPTLSQSLSSQRLKKKKKRLGGFG
ncbi:LANO_0F07822g1_1 [Lachancea nothofagi CBS 11611]|uniref:LANO_0F07822g1_1 n=1 Tax=Lachancea nothofagi CBS 11611 TaxID=1266666 RepID=A0A1G4K957_9SACH|nr:LANO_0F07822g1_1 [Lachancea nothofagi CBS 11611]